MNVTHAAICRGLASMAKTASLTKTAAFEKDAASKRWLEDSDLVKLCRLCKKPNQRRKN